MKRISYFPYFLLIFALFLTLNISNEMANLFRSKCVYFFTPPFQWAGFTKNLLLNAPTLSSKKPLSKNENTQLVLENENLKSQLNAVYEWLLFDQRIEEQTERIQSLTSHHESQGELYWREFFQRRSEELKDLINKQIQALPAKVIYREPTSWSSSLWINVGEEDNESLGRQIVAKDSPVLVGTSLVGVIEFVDRKKSRVRLITDSGLIPSVRALRGKMQNQELSQLLDAVIARLQSREDLPIDQAIAELLHIRENIQYTKEDLRLAKGELHGSSEPMWRTKSQVLKGIGFNYDYADSEGPSRNLQTGAFNKNTSLETTPILQKGDLLVTTGMDGVFPSGLNVAIVTKVHSLKEGAYCYDIEAKPTALNLEDLTSVFVIPKLNCF